MSVNYALESITNNDIVMEELHEMSLSMTGRDRKGYMEVAIEAFNDTNKQAVLMNKLFKETQKADAIDFGKIPDSKGNLIKYQYYPQMSDMIELLNELCQENPPASVTNMNKLNTLLLNNVEDFTFGYRTNNYIIMNTYRLMVLAMYEVIDVCIVDVTKDLRSKLTSGETKKEIRRNRKIMQTVGSFIKMYENGQWNTLMKAFKSGKVSIANESLSASLNIGKDTAEKIGGEFAEKNGLGILGLAKDQWDKFPKAVKFVGGGAVALILLLFLLRQLIYLFYRTANKISTSLKTSAKILRGSIEADRESQSDGTNTQIKALKNLEAVADVIDYKIIKTEQAAAKDISEANAQEFSKKELSSLDTTSFSF